MTRLCHLNDIIEGGCKEFTVDGTLLFAVKHQNKVYLYHNRCPHMGIQLNWQPDQFLDMDKTLIQCSTHGALFIIHSGECVAGPCRGQRLKPIFFELKEDVIYVNLS